MEDGHIGCVGHMNPDESAEEVTENKYGGRLGSQRHGGTGR